MMIKSPRIVSAQIHALRRRDDMQTKQLAEKLGYNRMSFHRRMTGEVEFRESELQRIAELFDVPVGFLFGEGPGPRSTP